MTSDKRGDPRHNLTNFQQVQDAATGKVVGYLGDISTNGVRVLRKMPMPIGETMRLRLRYILMGGENVTAEFDAQSLWESEGAGMAYPEIGLRISNLDDDARRQIERIVEDLLARSA